MQHDKLSFHDPGEMPEQMSQVAQGFSVHPAGPGQFSAEIEAIRLSKTGLFETATSNCQVISDGDLGYWSVNVPLRRPLTARVHGQLHVFGTGDAFVAHADEVLDLRMTARTPVLVLNVPRTRLNRYAAMLTGRQDTSLPCQLPHRISLSRRPGQAFQRHVEFIWAEARCGSPILDSPVLAEQLEASVLSALFLAAYPDSGQPACRGMHSTGARAVDFIQAHLAEPLSLAHIAAAAGVHGHTLQRAFHKEFDDTVMSFVRRHRLERARRMLRDADPDVHTVTEIAVANGFDHLSRFAGLYRHTYGELPSATLKSHPVGAKASP